MEKIKSNNEGGFKALADICQILSTGAPLDRIITRCLAISASGLSADIMATFLFDEQGLVLYPNQALGINPKTLKPIECMNITTMDELFDNNGQMIFEQNPGLIFATNKDKLNSKDKTICLPMIYQDNVIGVLIASRRADNYPFSDDEREFAKAITSIFVLSTGGTIPNQDIMDRERMEMAMQHAHSLRRCFTPTEIPSLRDYKVTVNNNSSLEMGGDFYDVLKVSSNSFIVAIGKTSGKGVEAGMNIARTIMELRGILGENIGPGKTLTKLNSILANQRRSGFLVNLALIKIDYLNNTLKFASAGNIRVYLACPAKIEITHLENRSATPLGILSSYRYEETEMEFCSNGSILAHTDGLASCINDNGVAISQLALEGCIFQALQEGKPSSELIMNELIEHTKMPVLQNDITLISIERKK